MKELYVNKTGSKNYTREDFIFSQPNTSKNHMMKILSEEDKTDYTSRTRRGHFLNVNERVSFFRSTAEDELITYMKER